MEIHIQELAISSQSCIGAASSAHGSLLDLTKTYSLCTYLLKLRYFSPAGIRLQSFSVQLSAVPVLPLLQPRNRISLRPLGLEHLSTQS